MSPNSYQGSSSNSNYSRSASNVSYHYDDDISVNNEGTNPTGCAACATAAWVDTLRFIQYLCM
eukprot:CAMPEP_0201685884 /NCGR_PEP_ID=MMETSP0578-20130828/538_1 /ASSEMBLY_ACC=CAM_ASM_000663 /TAXON_ID=267565 /ORGANISM="Skeletonema grethea, Strain CCMP 1804" /LENGTH=62 /DNA_ID=CAMNT_0048169865 /DNA_START=72 /DNA_END=260 /DNA_ORIENTATION=+